MIFLITDASFDPQRKRGVAGFIKIEAANIDALAKDPPNVFIKFLKESSSSRMELQAVLWSLENITRSSEPVVLYTDYEAVIKLNDRRKILEQRNFKSLKSGKLLANADLYQRFYQLFDALNPDIIWLKGHKPKYQQSPIETLFASVDRKTREELRNWQL